MPKVAQDCLDQEEDRHQVQNGMQQDPSFLTAKTLMYLLCSNEVSEFISLMETVGTEDGSKGINNNQTNIQGIHGAFRYLFESNIGHHELKDNDTHGNLEPKFV